MATPNDNTAYICLPSNTCTSSKLFSDLGKPTKRGIRKCYKCGVYNGTRGVVCKNKQCDAVFKDSAFKKGPNLDSVKLITGNSRQVFSVCVNDVEPDHRGFIQLPALNSHINSDILSEVTLCFVDSCQRLFDDSILQCHENEFRKSSSLCSHIKSALNNKNLAMDLQIKREFVNLLKIRNDLKEKLCTLSENEEGPFVQRISKNVLAVKCQVTPKYPLGYLHFRFIAGKSKESYNSYLCSCTESIGTPRRGTSGKVKCLHYYACICALASHPKYSEEFQQLVSLELPSVSVKQSLPTTTFETLNTILRNKDDVSKHLRKATKLKKVAKTLDHGKFRKLMPKVAALPVEITNSKRENVIHRWCHQVGVNGFAEWLSSVTKTLNDTLRLENCAIVTKVVFHISEELCNSFFKRLPNNPPDEFNSKYQQVLNINNESDLQSIFDTPEVKLMTKKHLIEDANQREGESVSYALQFDLTGSNGEDVGNSFVIQWSPGMESLLTDVGQLKFKYKIVIKRY